MQSRKFWASLIGLVAAVGAVYSVDIPRDKLPALLQVLAIIVASYNIGTGIESGLSSQKTRVINEFERRGEIVAVGRPVERRGPDA